MTLRTGVVRWSTQRQRQRPGRLQYYNFERRHTALGFITPGQRLAESRAASRGAVVNNVLINKLGEAKSRATGHR